MEIARGDRLMPVLVHIQTHLDEDLSLERLAERVDLSPQHFHRVFRGAIGETTRQYVERLRLERAAFFLRLGSSSVVDVAFMMGFQSHEVFTRAFKRHFGCVPRDYRKACDREHASGRSKHPSEQDFDPPAGMSSVQIHELGPLHLAFKRQLGPYEDVDPGLWRRVVDWLDARRIPGDRILKASVTMLRV